jgi:hypothetical protein
VKVIEGDGEALLVGGAEAEGVVEGVGVPLGEGVEEATRQTR